MIVIIDYGMGNLRSVQKAFEKVGFEALVTNDISVINKTKGLVVPGVGAFGKALENLERMQLKEVIIDHIKSGKPYLGICLGLQLLFSKSYEEGEHQGFDLVKGEVVCLPQDVKVPHMGWNQIKKTEEAPLLEGIPDGSYFYFVHSYYVKPEKREVIETTTDYGIEFASSISKDNIFATQFHPEKSAALGLKILENFGRSIN